MNDEVIRFGDSIPLDDDARTMPPVVDRLKARASQRIKREDLVIECTHNPGFNLVASTMISEDDIERIQKLGKKSAIAASIDTLAYFIIDFEVDGERQGFGFRSERAFELFDASTTKQAVRSFYGLDGDNKFEAECARDAGLIMIASGWRDDIAPQ